MTAGITIVDECLLGQLQKNGYGFVRQNLPSTMVDQLLSDHARSLLQAVEFQRSDATDHRAGHVAFHVLEREGSFPTLLEWLIDHGVVTTLERFLGGKLVLNSFGAFNNLSSTDASTRRGIHRDVRSWSADCLLMAQAVVMLDEFTVDNGATLLLPGSQHSPEFPGEEAFEAGYVNAVAPAGSIMLFDSRMWHAAGINLTERPRRCLTLSFSKAFVKPQFDYCRALGEEFCLSRRTEMKQLLGWHARVPSTLQEWYRPEDERFYRKDQG